MTLYQIFLIIAAVLICVVLPIVGAVNLWTWLRTKPSERPDRKGGGGGGLTGALMMGVDQLVRPSAEHRVEAENPIVKEDEQGGE